MDEATKETIEVGGPQKITRREFLRFLGMAGAAGVVAACKPGVSPETVIVTRVVEKFVTATPLPPEEEEVEVVPTVKEVEKVEPTVEEIKVKPTVKKPEVPPTIEPSPTPKKEIPTPTVEIEATPAAPVPVEIIEKEGQRLKVGGFEVFPPGVTFGENTTSFFAAKDIDGQSLTDSLEEKLGLTSPEKTTVVLPVDEKGSQPVIAFVDPDKNPRCFLINVGSFKVNSLAWQASEEFPYLERKQEETKEIVNPWLTLPEEFKEKEEGVRPVMLFVKERPVIAWMEEGKVLKIEEIKPAVLSAQASLEAPSYADEIKLKDEEEEMLLLEIPLAKGEVMTEALNCRRGPGTVYGTQGAFKEKDTFKVIGFFINRKEEKWYYIKTPEGDWGWVSADLVKVDYPSMMWELTPEMVPEEPEPEVTGKEVLLVEAGYRKNQELTGVYKIPIYKHPETGGLRMVREVESLGGTEEIIFAFEHVRTSHGLDISFSTSEGMVNKIGGKIALNPEYFTEEEATQRLEEAILFAHMLNWARKQGVAINTLAEADNYYTNAFLPALEEARANNKDFGYNLPYNNSKKESETGWVNILKTPVILERRIAGNEGIDWLAFWEIYSGPYDASRGVRTGVNEKGVLEIVIFERETDISSATEPTKRDLRQSSRWASDLVWFANWPQTVTSIPLPRPTEEDRGKPRMRIDKAFVPKAWTEGQTYDDPKILQVVPIVIP